MNLGFIKVASAIPEVTVADTQKNIEEIKSIAKEANNLKTEIVCFPELCITSYTCGDLFQQTIILQESEKALFELKDFTEEIDTTLIIGLPLQIKGATYNVAAVIGQGHIYGIVPKRYLPNYKEFYEKRWFASANKLGNTSDWNGIPLGTDLIFKTSTHIFGIELCEDLWAPIPPSSQLALGGAEVIYNLSADNEIVGKRDYLESLVAQQSARSICGYVFSGCGFGESTQDIVFDGKAYIYENGVKKKSSLHYSISHQLIHGEIDIERLNSERRSNTTFAECQGEYITKYRTICIKNKIAYDIFEDNAFTGIVDPHPFVPQGTKLDERCEEIISIQVMGLCKRLKHISAQNVVVGISGGLDSTLALLICEKAFRKLKLDTKGIYGITMPGFGTTDRTYNNAINLMKHLGITIREISIKESCIQHFKDIEHDINNHNITYENGQARERTQILMDYANKIGGIVIGTGDLSELALGWATYNGDHMSMYGVNTSVPKTLIKHLVEWIANKSNDNIKNTLLDIISTPISPELIPFDEQGQIKQKTEDIVGPYELHDFFIYELLRFGFQPKKIFFLAKEAFKGKYDDETIKKWIKIFFRRFFAQQFKRSCLPDGPKVGSCSLSPRGDWRMPSDASSNIWLNECNEL